MAKFWRPDEEITAEKLNQMQIDPLLKAVNNSGVKGGIESSALSSDTIDKDIGTGAGRSVAAEITEHELGNIHYEYDDGNNRWAMRSGSPGVTGKVEGSTGELEWNNDDFTGKRVNWQKITTDKWGNVICSEQIIDSGTHNTKMWSPKVCEGGEIWRRLGTIEADCKYKLPEGKSALMTWKYKAVNENNAFILPVPRQDGWETPAVLNVCTDGEVAPRTPSSHWIQTAGPDTGASVPIQGIGELGGIFAYQAQDYNGNNVGIGLASGIEFYDSNTIGQRNCINARPLSTTAKVDFGSGGKYGYIQISNVNPKHPWQFELSGDLRVPCGIDIGSDFWNNVDPGSSFAEKIIEKVDPGSGFIDKVLEKIPCAHGPICGGIGYYDWRVSRDPGPSPQCKGLMNGSVRRVKNGASIKNEEYARRSHSYRGGEILCGELGIATATFKFTSAYNDSNTACGKIAWNPNGGLVSGIMIDSDCRPYIDCEGFIHTPNKKWTNDNLICLSNAESYSWMGGAAAYPIYNWPVVDKCTWCHCRSKIGTMGKNLNPQGLVDGGVQTISVHDGTKTSAPHLYPDATHGQVIHHELGEVRCGRIGITTAFFTPYEDVGGNENVCLASILDGADFGNESRVNYKWNSGGIIRGVIPDIPWKGYMADCNEVLKPSWSIDDPEAKYEVWIPDRLPYVDIDGMLHLPTYGFRFSILRECNQTYFGPGFPSNIVRRNIAFPELKVVPGV